LWFMQQNRLTYQIGKQDRSVLRNSSQLEEERCSESGLTSIDDWDSGDDENEDSIPSKSTLRTLSNLESDSVAVTKRRMKRSAIVSAWRDHEALVDESKLETDLHDRLLLLQTQRERRHFWSPFNLMVLVSVAVLTAVLAKRLIIDTS